MRSLDPEKGIPAWFYAWFIFWVLVSLGVLGVGVWAVIELVQWVTSK